MRKQNKNTKYKEPENVGTVHTHTHTDYIKNKIAVYQ